jgi:hypothetical protein
MFGPGGLGDEISSAVRNAKTVYNPADMAKSLLPTQGGKDARQRLRQAQTDADQDNLNRHAAKAIAKGKQMGLDQTPTLASSMKKLQANPVAKEWVAGIVANWPQEAKNLDQSGSTIKEAPEYTTPGGIIVPANSKTAPSPATPATPASTRSINAREKYKTAVKDWIDTQLKTIKLDTIVGNETKFPQLKGIGNNLGDLLDTMVAQAGNISAQQETLKQILALVTAANHVIDWERRVGRGPTLADPGAGNQTAQPVNTSLTTDQLKTIGALAARSGDPAPKDTGNDFWNSFIQQAMAAAKR